MSRRGVLYLCWAALAGCLYFFENNTGTRVVLLAAALLPLVPVTRRILFGPDARRTEAPERQRISVLRRTDAEEWGDVREYRPGDPVNRIHWKLTAKREKLIVRDRETLPVTAPGEAAAIRPKRLAVLRRTLVCACLAASALALLTLFLLPGARVGAQALCNRLFAASEAANAYVYDRFPVPEDTPAGLAAALLALAGAGLTVAVLASGRRWAMLAATAGCALFQAYFGLAWPGEINVSLGALFVLSMARRPLKGRDALTLLAVFAAAALAVTIIWPGTDPGTETASERVRDSLSRLTERLAGGAVETPEGVTETRHTHTRTLTEGDGTARTERSFRLVTVEERQISGPEWINYLKTALMLLLLVALVTVPFLPFLWLNARRKKAETARAAFMTAGVSDAVCAIFRQVIGWLDAFDCGAGNLPFREWTDRVAETMPSGYAERFAPCARLFEEAAYSDHPLDESCRRQALSLLDDTERLLKPRATWRQRLRLKYGVCLWI